MWRAFNPITNVMEVFWRPAVNGVGGSRRGTGKLASSLEELAAGEGEEAEGRMRGLDGVRALAYLWVLAFEVCSAAAVAAAAAAAPAAAAAAVLLARQRMMG